MNPTTVPIYVTTHPYNYPSVYYDYNQPTYDPEYTSIQIDPTSGSLTSIAIEQDNLTPSIAGTFFIFTIAALVSIVIYAIVTYVK